MKTLIGRTILNVSNFLKFIFLKKKRLFQRATTRERKITDTG